MFWSLGDMYALCMGVECGLQIIQTKGTCGSALMLLIFNMYKTGLVVGKYREFLPYANFITAVFQNYY